MSFVRFQRAKRRAQLGEMLVDLQMRETTKRLEAVSDRLRAAQEHHRQAAGNSRSIRAGIEQAQARSTSLNESFVRHREYLASNLALEVLLSVEAERSERELAVCRQATRSVAEQLSHERRQIEDHKVRFRQASRGLALVEDLHHEFELEDLATVSNTRQEAYA